MSTIRSGVAGQSRLGRLPVLAPLRGRLNDLLAILPVSLIGHVVRKRGRLLALCDRLVARGRFGRAVALAEIVRHRNPFDGRLHLHLAAAAIARGDTATAARVIDRLAVPRDGISPSAVLLLEIIGTVEASGGYGTVYGNRQHRLATPLPQMRLCDVLAAQPGWKAVFGSSAAGRYQVIDSTLARLAEELRLDPQSPFHARLQDRIGLALLERRGFARFVAGDLPLADFALELAQEWAAFPVIAQVAGAHRLLEPGETFYAGDGRNRALISPALFVAILERCLALAAPHVPPAAR